jgi:hypothetical protein
MRLLSTCRAANLGAQAALGVCGLAILLAVATAVTGCGTPGAPQPPSLHLPEPVKNLAGVRAGDSISLHWTTPVKTTDRLPIHGPVIARACLRQSGAPCTSLGEVTVEPGQEGSFQHALPTEFTTGPATPISLTVELLSPKGRSAGPSNAVDSVAGKAPEGIRALTAEVRADGVALHWTEPKAGSQERTPDSSFTTLVRLHRRLLSSPSAPTGAKPAGGNGLGSFRPAAEPILRDLLVDPSEAAPGKAEIGTEVSGALDKTVRFGSTYEFTAQRLLRTTIGGQTLELASVVSPPVRVEVVDTFPPAVPQGLEAVLVPEEMTIDLSWQPDTEEDLAGYIVYRSIQTSAAGAGKASRVWDRISGQLPLAAGVFRDSKVEPGHVYRYAVSAIDVTGHESRRSAEAEETVPEATNNPK